MALSIDTPTALSGVLPSGNPIVFTIHGDDTMYPLADNTYIITVNVNGDQVCRVAIPSNDATINYDVAPIVRDFLEDHWNNDNDTVRGIVITEYCEVFVSAGERAGGNASLGADSDTIVVLNACATFEEYKNFFAYGFPPFQLANRIVFEGPSPFVLQMPQQWKDKAYEIGINDFVKLLYINNHIANYVCAEYDADGSPVGSYTYALQTLPASPYVEVPCFKVDTAMGHSLTKGHYYVTSLQKDNEVYAPICVFHIRNCNHENYSILYKSRFGGWWYIPTHLKHHRDIDISTETMTLALQSVSAHMRDMSAIRTSCQGHWVLNTDWIMEQERIVEIEDMLTSPNLYIMKSDDRGVTYIPVTFADGNYNSPFRRQDGLVQYQFQLNENFNMVR